MPYPNFHAARMVDPNKFKSIVQLKELENGIRLIGGSLKGKETTTVQAYRFPKEKFTEQQAKAWLKEHKLTPILFEKAEKKEEDKCGKKDSVSRCDIFEDMDQWMSESFVETPEGYLRGRAIVTNTGIFNYQQKDGSMLRELRTQEEVFSDRSLKSLRMIPMTDTHPGELVTVKNAKGLSVGFTGEDVRTDGHCVSIPLTITDHDAIQQIKNGKVALSCGYTADLEYKTGYAFGNNQYDCIQRNIGYNHIAIVDRGRAGDLARIPLMMDDDTLVTVHSSQIGDETIEDKKGEPMKKIILDGIEYEAEERVIIALNALKEDSAQKDKTIEEQKTQISKLTADKDQLADDLEKVKSERLSDSDIQAAVKERLAVVKVADALKVEYKEDTANADIKKSIILKQYPKAQLQDKDDVYINARYDAIVENLEDIVEKTVDAENKKAVFGDATHAPNTASAKKTQEEIKKERCDALEKQYLSYTGAVHVKGE